MVKKSIFVIALLGALASVSLAQDLPTPQQPGQLKIDTQWPYVCTVEWTPIDICTIKVYLKVGYFIEIDNCANLKINMVQVNCPQGQSFPCYKGCITIKVRSNFNAVIKIRKGNVVGNIIDGNNWKVYFRENAADTSTNKTSWDIPGDGNFHNVDVCVEAWNANIFNGVPGQNPQVGEVIISAIPASTECPD